MSDRSSQFDLLNVQPQLAVNELAAGAAHEFNNVLQIVSGYVTFARSTLPESSAVRVDLDRALQATERASQLATRLLQFARAQDDESGVADVSDAVESLSLLLKPIIGENIRVEIDACSDLPEAAAPDGALRQALLNLCVNARDAMPSGGVLRIGTDLVTLAGEESMNTGDAQQGERVMVFVEDTGEGMAPEVIDRLFDPFYSTKEPDRGTGLGMALVAEFVGRADGGLRLSSRPGAGSRFELYLRVAEPEPVGAALSRFIGVGAEAQEAN